MSRRLAAIAAAVLAALALAGVMPAAADDGDTVTLEASSTLIGQHSLLVIDVFVPEGADVEVDPAAASWNGVEVAAITKSTAREADGRTHVHLELQVAPFAPGPQQFAPAVNVIEGSAVTPRALPAVEWTVVPILGPDDPLELSPLSPPVAIDGAESPLLKPAIAAGGVLGVALLAGIAWLAARVYRNRPRPVPPPAPVPVDGPPDLAHAEGLLGHDPVAAYRSLAATVRSFVARQYGLPATALTTGELRSRMEAAGADRFQARLVGGLLEECDAVVYAGYRPASERRHADLTMAREIIEGTA